ncbi:MAG: efflux transporter permease subunit [Alphaproteobacteria bacterium]|nr:efflux transporter permease subunit [Alphaproteobacteria bacterium]
MNLSKPFIERPVMTTLVMAALVIFGAYGYSSLPVSDLPNIDFPTIQVSASLPGADPDTMASSVASPLENQFSTINGIDQMTSSSTQGTTSIQLQFSLDRSLDGAAQDVQSAISAATRNLPKALPQPPTFRKVNPADLPIMFLAMRSKTLKPSEVDEYAETLLGRQLSTIEGVAQVSVFGSAKYAVRVQADPSALAARQIGIDKLTNAVAAANVNLATGALNGATRSTVIHTGGQLNNAAEFNDQIVSYQNGSPVRLKDVARVIDGLENPYAKSWYKGDEAIVLAIFRQPGSNVVQVIDTIKKVLPQFQANLPPSVQLDVVFDRSQVIKASIEDVQYTLLIAGALVVGVIFVFLRRLSATIIPSIALPITIIGTFAGMAAFGFNLDNLSLMALTLSVGFVVDDAIVMLENIVRHIELGEKPYDAAMKGASEIGFTILSMTISLAAVFIPIVFMGGIVGRLLHEFAVTIIVAILFSGVVSITLTPMLCARMLKDEHGETHNWFYNWSERTFDSIQGAYDRSLRWSISHGRVILGIFAVSVIASVGLLMFMQQDFLPSDDTGRLQANIQAANGTSYRQMALYTQAVAKVVSQDPDVAGVLAQMDGANGSAGTNTSRLMMISLKPLSERHSTPEQMIRRLRPKVNRIPGVNVFVLNPPAIRLGARQARSSYQYTMQALDLGQLKEYSDKLMAVMRASGSFVDVNSDLEAAMPSVQVKINRDRAAAFGVSPQQIETALGSAFGGQQISQINTSSNQYEVIMELLPRYQRDASSLDRLYVTAADGTLVPLTAVTTMTASTVPLSVNHAGQIPAVTVSFDLPPGKALSDAVSGIRNASEEIGMPDSIQGNFQGTAAAFQDSTKGMGGLLLVAMVVVYIILGVLYESFIHPLTILSGLPSAAVGGLLTLWIAHLLFLAGITPSDMSLTLYAFVGMIMLIGIVKKNAIMMIDFALNRQRSDGVPPEQAIYEAAVVRFRPIMMTTMAALMGTLPIAFGTGSGAESRRPLGLCVAGGLVLSQLLTLYITPVIYSYLDRFSTRMSRKKTRRGPAQVPAE